MSTEPVTPSAAPDRKRFNAIIVTLISIVTVASAITAFLQNDASSRSNTAIRDGQDFAVRQMEAALPPALSGAPWMMPDAMSVSGKFVRRMFLRRT